MILFRGAKQGLDTMKGGSYYTDDYEIAESYAKSSNGIVYEFNTFLNLLNVDDLLCSSDIDEGLETVREELDNFENIFDNYDGIESSDSCQIILFGTLDINDNFKKQTFPELMNDVNSETRRYDW